jgi:hypothetical protein
MDRLLHFEDSGDVLKPFNVLQVLTPLAFSCFGH